MAHNNKSIRYVREDWAGQTGPITSQAGTGAFTADQLLVDVEVISDSDVLRDLVSVLLGGRELNLARCFNRLLS